MSIRRLIGTSTAAAALLAWAAPACAEQSYKVEFTGVQNGLRNKLQIISSLEKGVRDYPTAAALRRAARRDVDAFDEALKAAGFYKGKARFELVPDDDDDKTKVLFTIETGPAFQIVEYEILYQDDQPDRPANLEAAGVKATGSAAGADLRSVQEAFVNYLRESGYPQAEIAGRRAVADLDAGTAHAVFVFESGPKARFGDLKVDGLAKTDPDYVGKLRTWEPGEEFERSKIVSYRDRLAKTGLFSTINVAPGTPDESGAAPVLVNLEERKRRTIGAGASYSTSEGPGGRIFFENRNVFRHGESLRVELRGSEIEQAIDFDINKPLPTLPGHAFGNFEFSNETTDAYDARSLRLSAGLAKKWLNDRLTTHAALAFETSKVKTEGTEERTYYASAPLSVLWNTEDDLLNPTTGLRTSLVVTPYIGSDTFTQAEWSARTRYNFGENDRFTIAARAALGATFGSSLNDLPQNKRLYAGGGGSVRGYGYQEAGPLDVDGAPMGGRSLIEGAVELRTKITGNLQLAGFVDAGSVSPNQLPDFTQKFFIGYGGGLRYLTPIGPIRADVAFPLNRRDTDRGFQIYIALGQPF